MPLSCLGMQKSTSPVSYTHLAGDEVYLLVDRMAVATSKDAISRLTDSAETATVSYTHQMCIRDSSYKQATR